MAIGGALMGFGADHGDGGTGQFDGILRQYKEAQRLLSEAWLRWDARCEEAARQERADQGELAWWRQVFSCRFPSGNLPPVGTALLGSRFRLMVEDVDGELREWTRDD